MEGFAGFMLDNAIPAIQSFIPIPPDFPLELAAFPTSETVTQHMFGMMGVGRWTGGNAVQTETYSPTGVVPLYGATLGAVVLPWILLGSSTVQFSKGPMPMEVPGTLVIEERTSVGGAHSDEESRNHTAAHRRLKVLSLMVRAFQDWEDRLPKDDEWPKFILGGSENHPDSYGDALPNDPWDHPYVYQRLDGGGYRILSYGRDGKPGGEGPDADISVNGR